jgi:hypothetical protein
MPNEETKAKRLNYVAYANIGLGLFSFFAWALPGPCMLRFFWHDLDQTIVGRTDQTLVAIVSFMKAMTVVVVLCFWIFSIISLVNGYLILKRRRHRLCMILSGISIAGNPLGMIVGVISLVVLNKEWARHLFMESSQIGLD